MIRLMLSAFVALLLSLGTPLEASADRIDKLAKTLSKAKRKKLRISALLSLSKSSDSRALKALTRSLRSDREWSIRKLAARSLESFAQRPMSESDRATLKSAFAQAKKKDKDKRVRRIASAALKNFGSQKPSAVAKGKPSRLLVDVVFPKKPAKGTSHQKGKNMLRNSIRASIQNAGLSTIQNAPAAGMPALASKTGTGVGTFSLSPEISTLRVAKSKGQLIIECAVKIRVAPSASAGQKWVATDVAMVSGNGRVQTGSTSKAKSVASKLCVESVVNQLTTKKVLPYLASKSQRPSRRRKGSSVASR